MIAIIDYGLGNLASVKNALGFLKIPNLITANPKEISQAKALILPGVASAYQAMENLKARKLDLAIRKEIANSKPFLGLCLGMQLLFEKSEEGNTKCLGILKGKVKRFSTNLKVPQVGWNNVRGQGRLFKDIPNNSYFYFVHSYYCNPQDKSVVIGETEYGTPFCSILQTGNIFATQFHPEKSSDVGLQLLLNFWEMSK